MEIYRRVCTCSILQLVYDCLRVASVSIPSVAFLLPRFILHPSSSLLPFSSSFSSSLLPLSLPFLSLSLSLPLSLSLFPSSSLPFPFRSATFPPLSLSIPFPFCLFPSLSFSSPFPCRVPSLPFSSFSVPFLLLFPSLSPMAVPFSLPFPSRLSSSSPSKYSSYSCQLYMSVARIERSIRRLDLFVLASDSEPIQQGCVSAGMSLLQENVLAILVCKLVSLKGVGVL